MFAQVMPVDIRRTSNGFLVIGRSLSKETSRTVEDRFPRSPSEAKLIRLSLALSQMNLPVHGVIDGIFDMGYRITAQAGGHVFRGCLLSSVSCEDPGLDRNTTTHIHVLPLGRWTTIC
jgi:hypothetical protein